jgi:phage anti-repressor protein
MPNNHKNSLTTIEGFNVPQITKIGDQLMLSAQAVFYLVDFSETEFHVWFNDVVINNPLTMEIDDYVVDDSDSQDYLISIDLAKRILMVSGQWETYDIFLRLQHIDFQYEAGQLCF